LRWTNCPKGNIPRRDAEVSEFGGARLGVVDLIGTVPSGTRRALGGVRVPFRSFLRRARRARGRLVAATLVGAAAGACKHATSTSYQARFYRPAEAKSADPANSADFLKCHMPDGALYVFDHWQFQGAGLDAQVVGQGLWYSPDRGTRHPGAYSVPVRSVALFETTQPEEVTARTGEEGVIVLGVVTGASLSLSTLCLTNHKACFGSCPTFYVDDGQGRLALQAEGFSASVARTLEATDVDAMWTARPQGQALDVLMTNDALETHLVKRVRVLAAPRPAQTRVYRAGGQYFPAASVHRAVGCVSERGDCRGDVSDIDGREYISPADPTDLAARETMDLTFAPEPMLPGASAARRPHRGIVISARNSLLNTFVFYQLLASMGADAAGLIQQAERAGDDAAERWKTFGATLGGIEVSVLTEGQWVRAGEFLEVGPIAHEVQMVLLPDRASLGETRVRLSMARGNWKIDQIAIADLLAPVQPIALDPVTVLHQVGDPRSVAASADGRSGDGGGEGSPRAAERARGREDPTALRRLLGKGGHLATYPRDEYWLRFILPAGDHELFLESTGYYYEWTRTQWLGEQDLPLVALALSDPEGALREMAPLYKKIEPDMERYFWQSRVGGPR